MKDLATLKKELSANKGNKLLRTDMEQSEQDKQISGIIGDKMILLNNALRRGKVDTRSLEEVEAVAMTYLEGCRQTGTIPSFEGLAVAMGYSRRNLYYILQNRTDAVADFLDCCRTMFADIIQIASSKRLADNATSIFILKSMTGMGFTDKADQPIDTTADSETGMDANYYRNKYSDLLQD